MNLMALHSAGTPYVHVLSETLQRWNDTLGAFEAYNAGNWSDYSLSATQDGSSGDWYVQMPAAIEAGVVVAKQYLRAGGSPAEGDYCEAQQSFYWDETDLLEGGGVGEKLAVTLPTQITESGGLLVGPGDDQVTLHVAINGTPVDNAGVWISTDSAGANVVAGTLYTNGSGNVTFLLTAGSTYYMWAEKAGVNPIKGQQFVAVAD